MTHNQFMPDFLIIGAGKAGTTSLDNYLKQHPQIYMSKKKEPNFFAYQKYDPKTIAKERLDYYNGSVHSLKAYLDLFKSAKPGQLKGEVSPAYLKEYDAPYAIKEHLPHVKLIAILRQPVERLYSRYLHLARENQLPTRYFEDVLNKNTIWWKRDDLITEGFYYQHLKRYYDLFAAHQIKVIFYEDYKQDPGQTIKEILTFLNIDTQLNLDFSIKYNKSGFIKSKSYDRLIGHNSIIKNFTKEYIPSVYKNLKQNAWMQNIVTNVRDKNLARPKLDRELKHRITNEVYREDIENLQRLLDKDLSHWIKN